MSKQAAHSDNIAQLVSRADLADAARDDTDQIAAVLASTVDSLDTHTAAQLTLLNGAIGTVSQAATDNKMSLGEVIADVASHELRLDSLSTASGNADVSLASLAADKASRDEVRVRSHVFVPPG